MSQQPPWQQGTYSHPQPHPPSGPYYGPPAATLRTSVKGPRAMTLIGATLLVLAIALLAIALPTIVSTVPMHMVDNAGKPGTAAVAGLTAPGTTEVQLDPGYYDVFLASTGTFADLTGPIVVTSAEGRQVSVGDPAVTTSWTMFETHVISVASFHITTAGQYQVSTPELTLQGATAILGHGKNPTTVAAAGLELAGAIIIGMAGLGLTIGGGIWWGRRSSNRKRLTASQTPPPSGFAPVSGYPHP